MHKRWKLVVNESKSQVMKCTRLVDGSRMNVVLDGKLLEEVECFKYLHGAVDGGLDGEMKFRKVEEGKGVLNCR